MKVNREVIMGLLEKVEASYTVKISTDRAVKKLTRYIEKQGLPEDLSQEEKKALVTIGVMSGPTSSAEPSKGELPKKKETKKTAKPEKKTRKGRRADWMKSAVVALKTSDTIQEAEKEALKTYLADGGREVPNVKANAKINVSRAVRVLSIYGILKIDADGAITLK